MDIILATSNEHKVKEINEIVTGSNLNFILPPPNFDPIENGNSFEENSRIKAIAAWELGKTWTLADDSGLCIDALDGRPGIYSARYAETPSKRIERVLNELNGIQKRDARFVCAMTLINPKGNIEFACQGICKGSISLVPTGNNGFGYDPIFIPEGNSITIAELTETEKNKISHRSKALNKVLSYIQSNFQ